MPPPQAEIPCDAPVDVQIVSDLFLQYRFSAVVPFIQEFGVRIDVSGNLLQHITLDKRRIDGAERQRIFLSKLISII